MKLNFKEKYLIILVILCFVAVGFYYSYAIFVTKQLQENVVVVKLENKTLNLKVDGKESSVKVLKNTNKEYKCLECINCGLCINACPININPKYMYFNKDKKSKMYKKECIKCGMCSYVCPSKIDLYKGDNDDKK